MKNLMLVILVMVVCTSCTRAMYSKMYVRETFKNENQIVITHATAKLWFKEAYKQAIAHCNQYDQIATLTSQNCGNKNYLTSVAECFSTFSCTAKAQKLEQTQLQYLKMIEALERAQLQVQIERKDMAECMEIYGVRECQEMRKGK